MPAIRAIVSKIQGLIDKLNAMYLPKKGLDSSVFIFRENH